MTFAPKKLLNGSYIQELIEVIPGFNWTSQCLNNHDSNHGESTVLYS